MSARRQARARVPAALETVGGVPRCLAIGRCIEVWGAPEIYPDVQSIPAIAQTRRRFSIVRKWWLSGAGIESNRGWEVVPGGSAWSASHLIASGRGRDAHARLAAAKSSIDDLDVLKTEAQQLFTAAYAATDNRKEVLGHA